MWVIKSRAQLSWCEASLQSVQADVEACQRAQPEWPREIDRSIHVAYDEKLEAQPGPTLLTKLAPSKPMSTYTTLPLGYNI